MHPKSRVRMWAAVVGLAMVAAGCALPSTSTSSTTTTIPKTSTTVAPSSTSTTEDAVRAALNAEIDQLIGIAEEYRELKFLEPPTVTIVTEEELAARVRKQIEEELVPEDLARDTAVQVLLGLIGPDVDLLELYTDLYSEQVAGYYDGELEEMVVPAGTELSALQKVTLVHELTHALTDQYYDFDGRFETLDEEDRFEEISALQSVVEGDASFTELLYVTELPVGEQMEIVADALGQDTTVFDQTPRFIQDLLVFPYVQGLEFVQTLWSAETGFDLVNEAYREPPTTTEQIYHPEMYRDGENGRDIELPDTPVAGYQADEEALWGEVSFRVMFDQGLSAETAQRAAAGWGGDRYRVLWDGEQVVYVLLYQGDSISDAVEMYEALATYIGSAMNVGEAEQGEGDTTFVGDDYAYVALSEDRVLFIASSDPEVGPEVLTAFPGF